MPQIDLASWLYTYVAYRYRPINNIHPSIHPLLQEFSAIRFQCSLPSSLGEFPDYWDWLWHPGFPPVLVPIAIPSSPSIISRCFSIHSSSAIIFVFVFLLYDLATYLHPFRSEEHT